ncbi:hypothetical protein FN846DRAFT_971611 [Sphaerosporella brunnea]|uniref:Uncharacterized protein n=1 Tax=Sphaerosporella brunnea TaxID=1250544 RepID=A0A5J5EIZ1_9PEZI|nr:hypothetical protein FN846DRAFT_971611 [Sphaerosporella brunnea]
MTPAICSGRSSSLLLRESLEGVCAHVVFTVRVFGFGRSYTHRLVVLVHDVFTIHVVCFCFGFGRRYSHRLFVLVVLFTLYRFGVFWV